MPLACNDHGAEHALRETRLQHLALVHLGCSAGRASVRQGSYVRVFAIGHDVCLPSTPP